MGTLEGIYGHFNPRSPCGERPEYTVPRLKFPKFQSTLPVWGATRQDEIVFKQRIFQSTLPVWGATRAWADRMLLEYISIHAPRVGSDLRKSGRNLTTVLFQSTLPVWGATSEAGYAQRFVKISIHAPRVGSDNPARETEAQKLISIHAPRVGSDLAQAS